MYQLDLHSRAPIYQQLKEKILRLIMAGAIGPGDPLPSVRVMARELGITPHVGPVFCSDTFYQPTDEASRVMGQHGVLGVEMESAALYMLAARYGGRALAIMTVSDMVDGSAEQTTAKERETGFQDMMKIALETAACFAD